MQHLSDIFAGCKIFPCVEGTKDPATARGWKDASSDPAQIEAWAATNPNFNWAVACGLSGLFVFDIDPAGLDWWRDLLATNAAVHETVQSTLQVRTPKGGLHVYFRGEGPSTASRIAKGIDTRGGFMRDGALVSGGYVILPGSRTIRGQGRVDGDYSIVSGNRIADLPDAMRAIVPERKRHEVSGLAKDPAKDQPRNVDWAMGLIRNYVASGQVSVQGHGGNDTAFRVAASILDKAISPALCFDLLWEHWNPHCSPPWDDWELERIISNALEYGEDAAKGSKGFEASQDVFAAYLNYVPDSEPPKSRGRDKLQFLHSFADNMQEPRWLVPGILPARGTGMLYGESGSYKSFVALDIALCLAYGISGQWGAPPVKNDVLFFVGEAPVGTAKKRWPAWMEWQNIKNREDHRFVIKGNVPVFTDGEAWENVKADLEELQVNPSLIVIDTLSRLMTGMDENATKDASLVVSFLEDLSRFYNCFVLIVHHTGKDQTKGARGSSVYHANMDTVISTKLRQNGTELKVRKHKDADVSGDAQFLAVKPVGNSIVLEHSEMPSETDAKAGSKYDWASPKEVMEILTALEGSTSDSVLAAEIAGKYGVDKKIVLQQLSRNSDLAFLRPVKGRWQLPEWKFDL